MLKISRGLVTRVIIEATMHRIPITPNQVLLPTKSHDPQRRDVIWVSGYGVSGLWGFKRGLGGVGLPYTKES